MPDNNQNPQQGLNQGAQNFNRPQDAERQGNIEENTSKIIADLEQDLAETGISQITKKIQDKATSYSERMKGMAADFEGDSEAMTQEFVNRMNRCEESLLEMQEIAHEAVKNERILIQDLFASFENIPDAFNKFASRNTTNGNLEIKPEGESLISKMEDFIQLREEALDFVKSNPDSIDFDLNNVEPTEENWNKITQAYLNANPQIQDQYQSLDDIISSFGIQDAQAIDVIKQSLLDYEEGSQDIFESLCDANEAFINDINMLNQGEAYKRVLNQEKIKLSRKLGVRVEIGNRMHVVDKNGNSKTLVIRGIHFQSDTPYFDKQRDLELECEIIDSSLEKEILDEDSNVEHLLEKSIDGRYTCAVDGDILENFDVYPKCDSFAELEERLGFRSMEQDFTVGTTFSYRIDKSSPEKHFTQVLAWDIDSNHVFLSEPIPVNGLDSEHFLEALKHKETHGDLVNNYQVKLDDGTTAYKYSLEEFLNFSYRYQAEEDVYAEMDEKTESLTSEELDRRLSAHHDFMLKNGLAVSKKPIEIHAGNVLANLQGDKYEIKSVSGDMITLENLSYPKFDGDNPDPEARMEFNLPELLKFIKDQNLGMISKEKLQKEWSVDLPPIKNMSMPDWEWPEMPFGLMSMNDIIDISKVFGEKVSQRYKRKRDLRKASFQSALGQEKESLEATNKEFNERVDFHKNRYQEGGDSVRWSRELNNLKGANFRNTENRAKLKALVDLLSEDGSLSVLDENFIEIINKARKQTRGVITDPIKKYQNKDGSEVWKDRDGTKNEDAVAEALNYIFNNNGQPSNFGTQCISKNRSAFTSSMNDTKSKVDRLAKEGKYNFDEEFAKLFSKLGQSRAMDSGEYTGILQAMIDEGYGSLPQFFYYLYAGLSHTVNGQGPILDDQFIESLNYGKHPFLHAFTVHKDILFYKRDQIWSKFSSGQIPKFDGKSKSEVDKWIWSELLPLSQKSTKKHLDTVAENKYPKEYSGYVLGKLNYEEICNLFKVSERQVGGSLFPKANFTLHNVAFGQYANGYKYAVDMLEDSSNSMSDTQKLTFAQNLLTSGIALFGLTHGRYKQAENPHNASGRAFSKSQLSTLQTKDEYKEFTSTLRSIAANLSGCNVSRFLEDSAETFFEGNPKAEESHRQAENFIQAIESASLKDLTAAIKKATS